MSSNFIDASPPKTIEVNEREVTPIKFYFGLFFFEKKDLSVGLGLSRQYQVAQTGENLKYYALNIVADTIEGGVNEAASHILYILEGYSEYKKNVKIFIDIFGVQNGAQSGLYFSHLIKSDSVSGVEECLGFVSTETKCRINKIKEFASLTELNSFTFLYNEINKNVNAQNDVHEEDEPKDNPVEEFESTNSSANMLQGYIQEEHYLGEMLASNEKKTYISRSTSNIFTKIYSGWVINDMKVRGWLDEKQEKAANVGLVLMFMPECTVSKIGGASLLGFSVLANVGSAIISFELAGLRFPFKEERDENLNKAKQYLQNVFGDIIGKYTGKVFGSSFKKGYQIKLKRNEIKLKDLQQQKNVAQKQVKGKKNKIAEGKYYESRKRKIRTENVKISNILNNDIDKKVEDIVELLSIPQTMLKDYCNLNWKINFSK